MARVTKAQIDAMAIRFLNARRAFGLDAEAEKITVSAGSETYGNPTTVTAYKCDYGVVWQKRLDRSLNGAYDELRAATLALEDVQWELEREVRP